MSTRKFKEVVACGACNGDWAHKRLCEVCNATGEVLEPITLEELTEQAVKAERAAIRAQVESFIRMLDEIPGRDQSQDEGERSAYGDVIELLDSLEPKPPTPQEVIGAYLESDDDPTADEILAALASKGWKVEKS